jgi:diguanylate cyclase (GGDEF)-like protein
LTITDPLTGLANRRRFAETLTAEWHRALRTRVPIGLAMIDIDYFKSYNDSYGHLAGDHCLCRVATALAGAVRETDLAARYGGEEFSFILPNTGYSIAHRVAERARAAVCALKERHEDNHTGFVTISIGVSAMAPSTSTAPEQLIELADAALYAAKHQGRNQVLGRRWE